MWVGEGGVGGVEGVYEGLRDRWQGIITGTALTHTHTPAQTHTHTHTDCYLILHSCK